MLMFYFLVLNMLHQSRGLRDGDIGISISYYKEYNVKYICLLTCGSTAFIRYASKNSMFMSSVDIGEVSVDFHRLDTCLARRLPIGVLADSRCESFQTVINHASEKTLFDSKHKWLIFDQNGAITSNTTTVGTATLDNGTDEISPDNTLEHGGTVLSVLKELNMSVDADVKIAVPKGDGIYDLHEVYNYGKKLGGKVVTKKISTINRLDGFELSKRFTFYDRWDFNQLIMKMILVMTPKPEVFDPRVILGSETDPRCGAAMHSSAQMLHVISDIHNFKYTYNVSNSWVGPFLLNSTTTASSALYFDLADITPMLRYNPLSEDKVHLLQTPTNYLETRYYYRIPSSGAGKFENQFLTPLSAGTWWCVVGVCSVCGLVLLATSLFEERPYSLPYAFFSVVALACQQFFEDTDEKGIKKTSSARKLTILVTGMSCVLVYNYYTSSVVSWLLNGPPPSINSLWELINSPLQPLYEDVGYTRSWLEVPNYYYNKRNADAEEKMKQKMRLSMKKGSIFATVNDGIEMVKQGEVNVANERLSRTFDQRELCDLDSLVSMPKSLVYPAVQKNSPYTEFFSWSLMRLHERGILSCIHKRIRAREPKCEGSSPRPLALGGAAPAFVLLAFGFLLGTLIMLVERRIYCRRNGAL